MLKIRPQLQTSENTQDLSAATDLRDEAVMEIHLETVHFQVHTEGEKKNPTAPPQPNCLPKHPV